jgi:hypothetical protein
MQGALVPRARVYRRAAPAAHAVCGRQGGGGRVRCGFGLNGAKRNTPEQPK